MCVCVQHLTWPQIDRITYVGVLAPHLLVLLTLHKVYVVWLFIHSIHSSFNRGNDWRALNSLVVFDFWMFRVIGVCFPLDKFIALKSLVVFGLDVSRDFRLTLAFSAINSSRWNRLLFWFGCSPKKSSVRALSCIHELSKNPVTIQKLSKIGCFPGITRQLSKQS